MSTNQHEPHLPSLQLLLYEAERAWAYSRELTNLATTNAEKASALKRNATSRFRRATNWATQLISHCQALFAASRLSAEGLVQATAYTLILNGRFLSSRYEYEDALIQLSVARGLLDELASRAVTSRDQALATAFADEIGPEIRYSAHELGRAKAYDVDGIVNQLSAKHKNEIVVGYDGLMSKLAQGGAGGAEVERKKLKTIVWEGEPVPVRNPELVDVLLRVQHAEEKLQEAQTEKTPVAEGSQGDAGKKKERVGKGTKSKRGVAAYDAILLALSEAEDVARKLVEAQQVRWRYATRPSRRMLTSDILAQFRDHYEPCGDEGHPVRARIHHLSIALPPNSTRSSPHYHVDSPIVADIEPPTPSTNQREER